MEKPSNTDSWISEARGYCLQKYAEPLKKWIIPRKEHLACIIEGSEVIDEDGWIRVSNYNDFSSLITGDDGSLYMVSHFESRPAAMYLTKLNQQSNGRHHSRTRNQYHVFGHVP